MSLPRPDALLFDMDGVLVDTSASYRQVILETVRVITAGAFEPTLNWVEALKRSTGFNNDWDASLALVLLTDHRHGSTPDALSDQLLALGGGLPAVRRWLGAPESDAALASEVRRVFQALYLGPERFCASEEGDFPSLGHALDVGPYLDRERALVDLEVLLRLPQPKAIATGRPEAEARYAVERAGWGQVFLAVVSHDDCVRAGQRGKPDPWPLLEAARRSGIGSAAVSWYLGDTPDDVRAALAAGMVPVGIGATNEQREALLAAGAAAVFSNVESALVGT